MASFVAALACSATPMLAHGHPDRVDWLRSVVNESLRQLDADACGSEDKHPCGGRDFSNGGLAAWLMNAANFSGALHWLFKTGPDASFGGQAWAALLHEPAFMAGLNATAQAHMLGAVEHALPSLATWDSGAVPIAPDVSYSNMYMMGMVNCILIGEAPGINRTLGAAAAAHGYDLVEAWLTYASTAGNHEFDSPTYYWVQMNALTIGCLYASKPAKLCAILEHEWADVAANFFAPTETLSGPHSRDYDFLFGRGALQVHTYVNGLGEHPPVCEYKDSHCERTTDSQNALVLLNTLKVVAGAGYSPAAATLALAALPVREVRSRWLGQNRTANNESAARGDRYNYIVSGRYALGSTSSDYFTNTHTRYYPSPQDKPLALDFGVANMSQRKPVPSLTLSHDWRDSPYGHWYEPTTDKASHLAAHPGIVQHRNVLLATTALHPGEQLDGFDLTSFESLATNLILPHAAASAVLLRGRPFALPTTPFVAPLGVGDTLALRVSGTCVALRVIEADGCAGQAPALALKGDADGIDLGAMRLAAYHYRGPASPLQGSSHVRAAFALLVDECAADDALGRLSDELAAADVKTSVSANKVWRVEARLRGTDLEVTRDVSEPHCARWSCVLRRSINGTPVAQAPLLSVNGNDVAPLPPPSAMPARSEVPPPSCGAATSLSLGLSWGAVPGADLYEVQLALAPATPPAAAPPAPFLSTTSAAPSTTVHDLLPATRYVVALRARAAGNWSRVGSWAGCSTAALQPSQLHLLPPTRAPAPASGGGTIFFDVSPTPTEGSLDVQYRQAGGGAAWNATRVAGPPFSLTGLPAAVTVEVRVAPSGGAAPWSDAVEFRTADPAWEPLEAWRISENCGNSCEVDFLADHDTGNLLADVDFITHVSNSSHFVSDFNTSVITRYCTQRRAEPFADYVSCNGPDTEHYTCVCNNWIDRCIGRLDRSTCIDSHTCECSNASLLRSTEAIGRMPVYSPFPNMSHGHGTCSAPPRNRSTFLGYWYSFPKPAECPPTDTRAGALAGCSWGRRASQHFVRGEALLSLGFNTSTVCDVPQLLHNRDVITAAIDAHPSRCCGC